MLKKFLIPSMHHSVSSTPLATGLLILRIVAGVAFMLHGYGKIMSPFNWMGPDAAVPGVFQFLAALAEFGGGLAWIIGLLTPLASFGILCTMVVATMVHINKGDAFVGGYELAVVYGAIALLLMLTGPGKFSVDKVLAKKV